MFNVYDRSGILVGQEARYDKALQWALRLGGNLEWVDLEEEI